MCGEITRDIFGLAFNRMSAYFINNFSVKYSIYMSSCNIYNKESYISEES